jgi:hypothetical protein
LSDAVASGQYLAVPFHFSERRPHVNTVIVEGCINLPLFPLPMTADERRVATASFLTNPEHLVWEVWRGGDLCGVLTLSRITKGLDALAHLAFFDRQLIGRHKLVLTMIEWAFRELGLRRLSVEIPEHFPPLISFCRRKLGFRYEGERGIAASQLPIVLEAAGVNNPDSYAAKLGSRREQAHFDGTVWRDIVCLRVLREEFDVGRNQSRS